jgi:hypothetical protein
LAEVELVFNLNGERVAWPRVLDGLVGIPFSEVGIVEFGKQGDDVEPRQLVRQCRTYHWSGQWVSRLLTNLRLRKLGSRLLHKLAIGAVLGEEPHVFEICRREPLHAWEGSPEVGGKLINHFCPPALAALAFQNVAADVVVEMDLLGIGRKQGALSGPMDAGFQAGQPVGVIGGEREGGSHDWFNKIWCY